MTHASLFSGIGGAELAAAWMGWANLFHCEINPFGRKVLEYWFPNSISYEDIKKTDFREWRGKVDVLTGGFPCQPFSVAGQRKGADDDRYLWPEMLRAIREIQPAWIVGENVAGILTMVEPGSAVKLEGGNSIFEENHLYREERQFTIERICTDIEREGYSVQPFVIPACAVGAPHRRDRTWIVAYTNGHGGEPSGEGAGVERRGRQDDGQQSQRREQAERADGLHGVSQHASDTGSEGPFSRNIETNEGRQIKKEPIEQFSEDSRGRVEPFGTDSPQSRWRDFPTQSPVRSRDDGLPIPMDGITFSQWRTESIKAYGNAWVPQVAYEIFKAIEEYERNTDK